MLKRTTLMVDVLYDDEKVTERAAEKMVDSALRFPDAMQPGGTLTVENVLVQATGDVTPSSAEDRCPHCGGSDGRCVTDEAEFRGWRCNSQ